MRIRLAIEDIEPQHWIGWVLDLPACFSSATNAADAAALAPQRVQEYLTWLARRGVALPAVGKAFELDVVETFYAYPSHADPEYLVNAFFEDDRRPLSFWEVEIACRLLDWTRQDLLRVLQPAAPGQLTREIPGEVRGSLAGIVNHIAGAENWYLEQLDAGLPRESLPDDPLERISMVRANTRAQWVRWVGAERITENFGELWSARKIVRRTLWHERDHTQHIARLLAGS